MQIDSVRFHQSIRPTAHQAAATESAVEPQDFYEASPTRVAEIASNLSEHMPGEVLVKVKTGVDFQGLEGLTRDYGAKLLHKFDMPANMTATFDGQLVHLQLPEGVSTEQAMAAMEDDPRIDYSCSNDKLHAFAQNPDDLKTELWGLHNENGVDINAPEAWETNKGSRNGPVICVIDTGVDYNHPDLRNNMWTNPNEIPGNGIDDDNNGVIDDVHGYNAIDDSGDPMDDHAHGTHCAGTIGAEGDNGIGVVGVNWEAQIMGGKFLSASGGGTTADAIKAVIYATANGARITSNSWGGGGFSQALYDAFEASPAMHIIAAGNDSNNNDRRPTYPASYDLPNIVSVAAINSRGNMAGFSNYGATQVDVAAPGVNILSTVRNGRYSSFSGTSMACPHVAGVAGLIATQYPDISNEELKARLLDTATPQDNLQGKVLSGGRVDAAAALESDDTPPSAPSQMSATSVDYRRAQLSFVAPGDDGLQGTAQGYDIRYSFSPITNEDEFQQALQADSPMPVPAGETQTVELTLPPSDQAREVHFAVKAYDNFRNVSDMAMANTQLPAGTNAFDGSVAENFKPGGTWAQQEIDGRQAWTDSPDGNYESRTKMSLVSKPFNLENIEEATLMFESKMDLAEGDKVLLEVHNGSFFSWWRDMAVFEGSSDWTQQSIDISNFDGDDVRFRFRILSDSSQEADGFSVSDLKVVGKNQ